VNVSFCGDLVAPQTDPQHDGRAVDVTPKSQRPQSPIQGKHHNTTRLEGDELAQAKRRARKQEDVILAVFRASETPLGPWEVMHRCHAAGHAFLIGSVRRAITNLTEAGALEKLATFRRGDAGAKEHEWQAVAA